MDVEKSSNAKISKKSAAKFLETKDRGCSNLRARLLASFASKALRLSEDRLLFFLQASRTATLTGCYLITVLNTLSQFSDPTVHTANRDAKLSRDLALSLARSSHQLGAGLLILVVAPALLDAMPLQLAKPRITSLQIELAPRPLANALSDVRHLIALHRVNKVAIAVVSLVVNVSLPVDEVAHLVLVLPDLAVRVLPQVLKKRDIASQPNLCGLLLG